MQLLVFPLFHIIRNIGVGPTMAPTCFTHRFYILKDGRVIGRWDEAAVLDRPEIATKAELHAVKELFLAGDQRLNRGPLEIFIFTTSAIVARRLLIKKLKAEK